MEIVQLDHNYSKQLGAQHCVPKCPTRYIYMQKPQRINNNDVEVAFNASEIIDVCDSDSQPPKTLTIDGSSLINAPDTGTWEDSLDYSSWNPQQSSLFQDVIAVLKSYQLATGVSLYKSSALIKKHLALSKGSMRLLRLLCSVNYNRDLFLWLHNLLKCSNDYEVSWLELISFFNFKYRGLFDKMQVLTQLGPLNPRMLPDRPKLPHLQYMNGVVFVVLPPRPHWFSEPRHKTFVWSLSKFFQVKSVKPSHRSSHGSAGLSLRRWLRNLVIETRNMIKKLQSSPLATTTTIDVPSSKSAAKVKVVLLAWGATAMLACQLAHNMEIEEPDNPVAAVVCLGPTVCSFAHGLRGHGNDPLTVEKMRVPLLFVTGERANAANVDDIEDFRDRLPNDVKTKVVVVGGADDRLALCSAKQLSMNVSQADMDVAVVEEIYSFISFVITGISIEVNFGKTEGADVPHQSRAETSAGSKRSAQYGNRNQGTRPSKASRLAASLPTSQLSSSIASAVHPRGLLPLTLLLDPTPPASGPSTATAAQSSDQLEVMCHDYAASSLPVSAIVGQSQAAIPIYSNASSEQSLRYMLSAGTVAASDAVKRPAAIVATAPGATVTLRCPAPLVYRKKVAPAPVTTAVPPAVVDTAKVLVQHPSSSSTVSIINVPSSSSNVFVLSSHVKE